MLQVVNVSKVYKPKNGAVVNALDGVSLSFAEKGMVFLLGKSGSGKSTLLNVCGGLDSPTSGEIIVKGRSSKNFSQSDFDSYRNTFVGFIFQEYNILNEFSVEDNIALALELQGKPKDKKVIANLLEQVDLTGFGKRKPNTLSGGQKQRIAIARALVKNPEIIMADEPTGALDSATGRQVFDTLKKLSRDKLVIVVSHDRDFAEQYGDRIIEMKDGKVLSDVSKTNEQSTAITSNISTMGSVLCVKDAKNLNDTDFEQIKAFLKKNSGEVIVASGEQDVVSFKKNSRISDTGREVFKMTKEQEKKAYTKEQSRFIRSKLPLRHAIKIGLSSIKNKPVRLFFTILLCTVAFIMFGLLSTMSFYNSENTFKQTLNDTEINIVRLDKEYKMETTWYSNGEKGSTYDQYISTAFTPAELKELAEKYGNTVFGTVRAWTNISVRSTPSKYWMNNIEFLGYLPPENALRDTINGAYPKNKDEICISSYLAEVIVNCGTYDENGNNIEITEPSQILGKKIVLSGTAYKVVGIIDSGIISAKYDAIKTGEQVNDGLVYDLQKELSDGLHFVAFVHEDRFNMFAKEGREDYYKENFKRIVLANKANGSYEFPEYSNAVYVGEDEFNSSANKYYISNGNTSLGENGTLLPSRLFFEQVANIYNNKYENATTDAQYRKIDQITRLCYELMEGGTYSEKGELSPFSDVQIAEKTKQLMTVLAADKVKITVGVKLYNQESNSIIGDTKEFNVIGFYEKSGNYGEYEIVIPSPIAKDMWEEQKGVLVYYSESTTKYVAPADAVYSTVFLPMQKDAESIEGFWQIYSSDNFGEDDTKQSLSSYFIMDLQMIDSFVKDFSEIFLWVGLVLALFAALLFSNFVSVSISQKKREIGILRAVGARGADVFKIFFSESVFIAVICVLLSTIGCILGCTWINGEMASSLGASLFVFGPMSLAVLIGIAALTAIIATFLPVFNAARKKPVDSIRAI